MKTLSSRRFPLISGEEERESLALTPAISLGERAGVRGTIYKTNLL